VFALELCDEAPPKKAEYTAKPFPLPTLVSPHKVEEESSDVIDTNKALPGATSGCEVNSLTSYLKDVYKNRLLTKEEEEELAIRIGRGEQEAVNRMKQF